MKSVLSILVAVVATLASAEVFVWKVSDGDTIWVSDETGKKTKVRMNRIDAPEMNQPYGKESADRLAELVLGKYVTLQSDGTDRYGRSLEVVLVETNATTHAKMDVNLQLVKEGLAWQYYTDKTPEYTTAFAEAKKKKVGLWSKENPVNPYEWRKMKVPSAPDAEYNSRKVAIPKRKTGNGKR